MPARNQNVHSQQPAQSFARVERLEERRLFSVATIPIQNHALPKGTNFPGNLTVTANGNVWFSCGLAAEVGFVSPAGKVKMISTKSASSHGMDTLTVGPDGNVWFGELFDNVIGEVTAKGQVATYHLSGGHGPVNMTLGPDGHLWLATFDNYIGRVDSVADGQASVSWFKHTGEGMHQIISYNGQLYFSESDQIGSIDTNGVFTGEHKMPSGGNVQSMCIGPDHNLWFTEDRPTSSDPSNFIGYMTPDGNVVEYSVAASIGDLSGISADGHKRLLFRDGDSIEEMTLQGKIVASKKLGFIAGGGSVVKNAKGKVWCAEGVLDKLVLANV